MSQRFFSEMKYTLNELKYVIYNDIRKNNDSITNNFTEKSFSMKSEINVANSYNLFSYLPKKIHNF